MEQFGEYDEFSEPALRSIEEFRQLGANTLLCARREYGESGELSSVISSRRFEVFRKRPGDVPLRGRTRSVPEDRRDVGLAPREATTSASEGPYEVRCGAERSTGT